VSENIRPPIEPGPELDAWLAPYLGWHKKVLPERGNRFCHFPAETQWFEPGYPKPRPNVSRWSSDNGLAIDQIVPAMATKDWCLLLEWSVPNGDSVAAVFRKFGNWKLIGYAIHSTVAGAIALAAAKALSAEAGKGE